MILRTPFIITSRLLPGLQVGDYTVSIEYGEETQDGRSQYIQHIDGPGMEETIDDHYSECGKASLQDGMRSFLSFALACVESIEYGQRHNTKGENADLFSEKVANWMVEHKDELEALSIEIEE